MNIIGLPEITNFSSQDYRAHQQNHVGIQLENGVLAFANQNGLLLYDGRQWQLHDELRDHNIQSLIEHNGRIYVGGINSFGFYEPDVESEVRYVDLSEYVTPFSEECFEINSIYPFGNGLILAGQEIIIYYSDGLFSDARHILCERSGQVNENNIFRYDGLLYMACSGSEIYRLRVVEGELIRSRYELFSLPDISDVSVIKLSTNQLLVSTDRELFIYKDGGIRQFLPSTQFDLNSITAAKRVDNKLAISVRFEGLYVFRDDGELLYHLTTKEGLQSDIHTNFFKDEMGNLWISSFNGIDKIDISSGKLLVDDRHGLLTDVLTMNVINGHYFMGLQNGLYVLPASSNDRTFRKITERSYFFTEIKKLEKGVVALSNESLWYVDENLVARKVLDVALRNIHVLKTDSGFRIIGLRNMGWVDISVNTNEDRFEVIQKGSNIRGNFKQFISAEPYLWAVTHDGFLFQMRFSEQLSLELINLYRYISDEENRIYSAFALEDTLRISGREGYYTLQSGRFEPDVVLNKILGDISIHDAHVANESMIAFRYRKKSDDFYKTGRLFKSDGNWKLDINSFASLQSEAKNFVFVDPDTSVWVSTVGSAIRFESSSFQAYQQNISPVTPAVRFIKNYTTDSLLYSIFSPSDFLKLDSDTRNIRVDYFSGQYRAPRNIEFQTRLVGLQEGWTEWRPGKVRVYTNLNSGSYEFQLRSKSENGQISEMFTLPITIAPPWYQSTIAYISYSILFILLIYYGVLYLSNASKRREADLEEQIRKRTSELEDKKLKLQKQAEELQFINNQRTQFFNNISHEFRTPLTLIMAPLQRVLEREGLDQEDKQGLEVAHRNAMRLRSLTNQMLDITKVQSGKSLFNPEDIEIKQLIMNIANRFVFKAKQEKKDFGYRFPEHDLRGNYDAEKMDIIISNLLSNAFKFSKSGDKIIITAGYDRGDDGQNLLKIRVEDTGIGIPKDQQEFIFDYYYQVEMSELTYSEGTGIGLSYVKDLMEMHKGTISIDSRVGVYTSFDLTFPTDNEYHAPGFKEILENKMSYFITDIPVLPGEIISQDKTSANSTILIVEDNRDLQTYLKILFKTDYNVILADNGKHALEQISKKRPDLIISDVMMPEMDGWTFLNLLKQNQSLRKIPLIMLTALTEAEDKLKALRTGVDDYISKPFDKSELVIRVQNLLKNYEERKKQEENSENITESIESETGTTVTAMYNKIISVVEENFANSNFSSSELAHKLAMSERSMYDKVKLASGLTPVQLINQKRIEHSRKLLIENLEMTISEIAFETGFSSSTYFSRTFKKVVGITPAQYRNRHK